MQTYRCVNPVVDGDVNFISLWQYGDGGCGSVYTTLLLCFRGRAARDVHAGFVFQNLKTGGVPAGAHLHQKSLP